MLEWLQNPIVSIAFAIGLMFFGYFFGLFEGRGQGYKRRQEEEAEKEESAPVPEPAPIDSPVLPPDETPILDVSRDKDDQLLLTLDGHRTDPTTLSVDQRKRLIEVLTLMRPWLESSKPASAPAQPKPASSQPGAQSPQTASTSTARPSPEATPAPVTESRSATPAPSDNDDASAASAQSIVSQIDSILQAHIVGSPLAEKGIRLQESPEGGVIVWVGMNKFQGVEDVPDEQIRAAIRTAIAKWESRYTPGI